MINLKFLGIILSFLAVTRNTNPQTNHQSLVNVLMVHQHTLLTEKKFNLNVMAMIYWVTFHLNK